MQNRNPYKRNRDQIREKPVYNNPFCEYMYNRNRSVQNEQPYEHPYNRGNYYVIREIKGEEKEFPVFKKNTLHEHYVYYTTQNERYTWSQVRNNIHLKGGNGEIMYLQIKDKKYLLVPISNNTQKELIGGKIENYKELVKECFGLDSTLSDNVNNQLSVYNNIATTRKDVHPQETTNNIPYPNDDDTPPLEKKSVFDLFGLGNGDIFQQNDTVSAPNTNNSFFSQPKQPDQNQPLNNNNNTNPKISITGLLNPGIPTNNEFNFDNKPQKSAISHLLNNESEEKDNNESEREKFPLFTFNPSNKY